MAEILFRPVCSNCNHQIHDLIAYEEHTIPIEGYNSLILSYKDYSISPTRCPYCGEYFTSIEMPGSVPFNNRLSLSARKDD